MSGREPHWPDGVQSIGIEDLARLGLNARNQLYWDGRRIEVRQALTLTKVQKTLAVVVSVCAILGGIGGFITGINNASIFLCARGYTVLACPTPATNPSATTAPARP
jgi:hypothetical protein